MGTTRLALISGPVASGKTTAALKLSALARLQGYRAASLDMDEFVETIAGDDWSFVQRNDRILAAQLASSAVKKLFEQGNELVAVAGSTLSSYEWEHLLESLEPEPEPCFVLLRVSNHEAVQRARNDRCRLPTKDPAVVARLASRIDWSAIRKQDLDLLTDALSADKVVEIIYQEIFSR